MSDESVRHNIKNNIAYIIGQIRRTHCMDVLGATGKHIALDDKLFASKIFGTKYVSRWICEAVVLTAPHRSKCIPFVT